MANYLVALALGPVQGFIAAARRTRDLWFGSYLLSEVSKAAALVLHQQQARLVFPAPLSEVDLTPKSELNVGNKVMAVAGTDDPGRLMAFAREGAVERWRAMAEDVRRKLDAGTVDAEMWQLQLDDMLELYSAWVPVEDYEAGYNNARIRLERLLGARKTTREFKPGADAFNAGPGFGKLKSSLDAARETVLTKALTVRDRRKLWLSKGEQLDCPGLVKRAGDIPEQFAPVTRIALEPWLDQVPDDYLAEANAAFEPLVGHNIVTRVKPERFQRLPYDGGFLYPSRIESQLGELEDDEQLLSASLNSLRAARKKLYKKFGLPSPYFAVLAADGDKMGEFIDLPHNRIGDHIAITQSLAGFAKQARDCVHRHQGACVYAGGDDVLALLPLHRAVACAHALSNTFNEVMAPIAANGKKVPTLSVGLGIGHVLTPFARLLSLGREAEKLAKEGTDDTPRHMKRNALAISVGVRSGARIDIRGNWDSGMDQRLEKWMAYYKEDLLSDKTPYDLRQATFRIDWAHNRDDFGTIAELEAGRVLGKKRANAGETALSAEVKNTITDAISEHGIEAITKELLVARWLSQKDKE